MFFVPPFRSVLGLALSGLSTVWDDGSGPDRGLHQVTFSLWQLTHQSRHVPPILVDQFPLLQGQALAPISRLMARVWGNSDANCKEAKVALKPKPEPSEEPEKRRMKALFSRWFFGGWNDLFIEFLQKTPWGPHDFPMNGH
ncbi:unnamed protein product [Cladocopium goreaui]|uniref:Uncharacterized protein n=1 Tax=Cladocopium goreaui TaxID=2562237 RepID=A0A9P1GMM3_9DINO|nr:unnamed protein product [Cladocopium goreaui]